MDCNMDWYCRGLCNVECNILPSTQLKNTNYYHYAVISIARPPKCLTIKSQSDPKDFSSFRSFNLERSLESFPALVPSVYYVCNVVPALPPGSLVVRKVYTIRT